MQRDEAIGQDEGPQHDQEGARPAGASEPQRPHQPEDDRDGGSERPVFRSGAPKVLAADVVGGVQDSQNRAQEGNKKDGQRLELPEASPRVAPGDDGAQHGQGTGRQQGDQDGGNRKPFVFRVDIDLPGCGHEMTRGDHPEFDEGDQTGRKHGLAKTTPGEIQADQPDEADQAAHRHVDGVDVGAAKLMNEVEAAQRNGQQTGYH